MGQPMLLKSPEDLSQMGEMEKYVLGCILIDPECMELEKRINVDSFHNPRNRLVWMAIADLKKEKKAVDACMVAEALANNGQLEAAGGPVYLNELLESPSQVANYCFYANTILEKQQSAELRLKLEKVNDNLRNGGKTEDALSELNSLNLSPSKVQFDFLSTEELLAADNTLEYLVPGILVKGQPCILAGPKKCLKTNILIDLGVSLASGSPFLGKFHIPSSIKTGIMSGESGQETISETLQRIVQSKKLAPDQLKDLSLCFQLPQLDNNSDLLELRRIIKSKELEVLILDPAYLALNLAESASNLFIVGDKLKQLSSLGQDTGCTILLVHHTRKGNGYNEFSEPQLQDISYAGFQEWTRQWLLLNRREAYQPERAGVHKLHFVAGGSAGHSQSWAIDIHEGSREDKTGRIWDVRIKSYSDLRSENRTSREKEKERKEQIQSKSDIHKVITALKKHKEKATKSTIKNLAALSNHRTERALSHLLENGRLKETQVTKSNGQTYPGYELTRNDSESLRTSNYPDCNISHTEHSPL